MARHRSDAAPAPARTLADLPDRTGPSTGARALPRVAVPGAVPTPGAPVPAMRSGGLPLAPESPALGLPVVGVAPETNRLDLAAIALASARGGTTVGGGAARPPSPPAGIPLARTGSPLSGPLPLAPAAHGRGPGAWRHFLGTRRALVGLTVAGAVAGAGVAVVGVAGAMAGPDGPTREAPAAVQYGGQQDSGGQGAGGPDTAGLDTGPQQGGDQGRAGSGSGY